MANAEGRPRAGRGLRLHARRARSSRCRSGATPIDFAYAIHTEVGHACIGARVNGRLVPLDSKLASGDTVEIFTSKVEGAGPVADWLQFVATHRARQQDPPVVLPRAARGRHRDGPRRAGQGAAPRGPAGAEARSRRNVLDEIAEAHELRRPRRAVRRHRREPRVGQVGRRAGRASAARRRPASSEEQLPTTVRQPRRGLAASRGNRRRARRGPRRRHGAAVALLHAGARRRDHGLRHPGPRRVGAPRRLRQRGVAGRRARPTGSSTSSGTASSAACFVASIEVKALDRARLLRDVTRGAGRPPRQHPRLQHRTPAPTASSKMRFDFELGDPSHLDSLLSHDQAASTRVYDAYRVLPGKGG